MTSRAPRAATCQLVSRQNSSERIRVTGGFATLGRQTCLTAGPKEARAWTINKGAPAPQAAAVIHTDFKRGFIKAEVVSHDNLCRGLNGRGQGTWQGAHRGQGLRDG
jgi:ribosome-binding ATPase YchF (GTP1/OBG family)